MVEPVPVVEDAPELFVVVLLEAPVASVPFIVPDWPEELLLRLRRERRVVVDVLVLLFELSMAGLDCPVAVPVVLFDFWSMEGLDCPVAVLVCPVCDAVEVALESLLAVGLELVAVGLEVEL